MPCGPQLVEDLEDGLLRRHVEPGQRLVHEQQLGFLGQGAGDEDALLLPAR